MPIELESVIPLGRRLSEYEKMFGLPEAGDRGKILDCGGGPSSFNRELTEKGGSAVSVDPLYRFSRADIERRIDETFDDIMRQTQANRDKYIWKQIADIDDWREKRMTAMKLFLADFDAGKQEGRYRPEALPVLSFPDQEFDLALSSHFLLLYDELLDLEFHIASITEMLRVAREVRIFPVLNLNAGQSAHLAALSAHFGKQGLRVGKTTVDYEFQRGGNEYLRIHR